MTEFHELLHPRKISSIEAGEIVLYASSDGGTTFYPVKLSADGGLLTGGTSKAVATAKIDIATAARHEIVAATASQQIHICAITFTLSTENDLTFENGTTALTGVMPFGGTNEPKGMTLNLNPFPWIMTVNTAFNITLSNGSQVSGWVQYYKE